MAVVKELLNTQNAEVVKRYLKRLEAFAGGVVTIESLGGALRGVCMGRTVEELEAAAEKIIKGVSEASGKLDVYENIEGLINDKLEDYLSELSPEQQKGCLLNLFDALKGIDAEGVPECGPELTQLLAGLPTEDLKGYVAELMESGASFAALKNLSVIRTACELAEAQVAEVGQEKPDGQEYAYSRQDEICLSAAALYTACVNGELPPELAENPELLGAGAAIQADAVDAINMIITEGGFNGAEEICDILVKALVVLLYIALCVGGMFLIAGVWAALLTSIESLLLALLAGFLATVVLEGVWFGLCMLLDAAYENLGAYIANEIIPKIKAFFKKLNELFNGSGVEAEAKVIGGAYENTDNAIPGLEYDESDYFNNIPRRVNNEYSY